MSPEIIETFTAILYQRGLIPKRHRKAWKDIEDEDLFKAVLKELQDCSTRGTSMTDRLYKMIADLNVPSFNIKQFPNFINLLRGRILTGLRNAGKIAPEVHDTEDDWAEDGKTLKKLTDQLKNIILQKCHNSPYLQHSLDMITQSPEYNNTKNPMIFSTLLDKLTDELKGLAKTSDFIEKYNFVQVHANNHSNKRDRNGQKKSEQTTTSTTAVNTPAGHKTSNRTLCKGCGRAHPGDHTTCFFNNVHPNFSQSN
jgi:hypothetical protein